MGNRSLVILQVPFDESENREHMRGERNAPGLFTQGERLTRKFPA